MASNLFGARADFPGVQMQQSGVVRRGTSLPDINGGYPGNVYLDTDSGALYRKVLGSGHGGSSWSQLFTLTDGALITSTKWFGDALPVNSIGLDGDFFLLWGCDVSSNEPEVYGPKAAGVWPAVPRAGSIEA